MTFNFVSIFLFKNEMINPRVLACRNVGHVWQPDLRQGQWKAEQLQHHWSPTERRWILTSNPERVSLQVAEDVMTVAYDSGINLFDTAEVYSAGKWVPAHVPRSVHILDSTVHCRFSRSSQQRTIVHRYVSASPRSSSTHAAKMTTWWKNVSPPSGPKWFWETSSRRKDGGRVFPCFSRF